MVKLKGAPADGFNRLQHIQFMMKTEILDIRYTNIDRKFKKQCQLHRKMSYKWDISEKQLRSFKKTQMQSVHPSPEFANWQIRFMPYSDDGYSRLKLVLYGLPTLVDYIVAKVQFKYGDNDSCENQEDEYKFGFVKYMAEERGHRGSIVDPGSGSGSVLGSGGGSYTDIVMRAEWNKDTLLSSDLYKMTALYFIVDIEIIKVYAFTDGAKESKSVSIPPYYWKKYNIIKQDRDSMMNEMGNGILMRNVNKQSEIMKDGKRCKHKENMQTQRIRWEMHLN